jgi:hypothetical protein
MTKQIQNKYKAAIKKRIFAKNEIDQVCRMKREIDKSSSWTEKQNIIKLIESSMKAKGGYNLTKEQTNLGFSWLLEYAFKKNGQPRQQKHNPFNDQHREVIKNFSHFQWCGIRDINSGADNCGHYRPVYRVVAKDGKFFTYVPNVPFNGDPIVSCSSVVDPKNGNSVEKIDKMVDRYTNDGLAIARVQKAVDKKISSILKCGEMHSGFYGIYIKVNESVGVKLFGSIDKKGIYKGLYDTVIEAENGQLCSDAHEEFALLERAQLTGISPIPFAVQVFKVQDNDRSGYMVGLIMEHCGEVVYDWDQEMINEVDFLAERLENEAGLNHSDIHSENVVVSKKGNIKIIDFSPDYIHKVA